MLKMVFVLSFLTFFAVPVIAQDTHCVTIGDTLNCTGGLAATYANAGAEIGAGIGAIGASIGESLAMRRLRKDAETKSATAVAYCVQNPNEDGCRYTLAFIGTYCTVYDPKLGKLKECKQMRIMQIVAPPIDTPIGSFVHGREPDPPNPHNVDISEKSKDSLDKTVRVIFCREHPDSSVYAPKDVIGTTETGSIKEHEKDEVQVNTCTFDLRYINAECTVIDPQYKKKVQCAAMKLENPLLADIQ